MPGRELAKFLVNERQQFACGGRLALLNPIENPRDVVHDAAIVQAVRSCIDCATRYGSG
jgi:hypothetical protein